MKLIGLTIEGLRKIRAAELDFDGKHLIQVRGKNGAGKSTVLDAIQYLLRGSRSIPPGVVTHDLDKAQIVGRIDDYVIKRTIRASGQSALSIEREDGKVARPQEFLDSISGQFLDPEWFSKLPGPEKRGVLMDCLGIDFSEIDKEIADAEYERLLCGRDLKSLGKPVSVEKTEAVSLADLMAERKGLIAWNEEQDRIGEALKKEVKITVSNIVSWMEDVDSIDKLGEALQSSQKEYQWLIDRNLPNPAERKDLSEIEAAIARAEETNEKARRYEQYKETLEKVEEKKKEYEELSRKVEALRGKRISMVKDAKLPVLGLEITDTGLSHRGVNDENWSDSESMKIALMLAVAFSGELKTVYIKRGEALDSESLEKIKAFAEKNDYQVIMEIVDDSYSGDADGVVWIEEGVVLQGGNDG